MAVYQFSTLSDGQAISFNASLDRLNFDQTSVAAGDLSLAMEGSSLRVVVKSGAVAGKDVLLLNTSLGQIAGGINFTFADGSVVRIGDNTVGTANDGAANFLSGGAGRDLLMGLGGNDNLQAGDNNDSVIGGAGNDTVSGNNGNDWLEGNAGIDTLNGGGGQDSFLMREFGAANADLLADFSTGWDNIQLDAAAFTQIGAAGRFAAGDARFFAGTAAHDADDRIIFNSATGQIFYDADGNGAGAAQLIGTLGGGRTVVASDFWVLGTPGGGGNTINGTSGGDSIAGTEGADTINGFAGVDFIDGRGGNDSIDGGADFDSLWGGNGSDTVNGGEGPDSIHAGDDGMADLILGGAGNDTMLSFSAADTILGGDGNDLLLTFGVAGDSLDGGAGIDTVQVFASGAVVDLSSGTITSGTDRGTVASIENVTGSHLSERIIGNAVANVLDGGQGTDTIEGGAGNDTLSGSLDHDTLTGGAGVDQFLFTWTIGAAHADALTDFASGADQIHFDAAFLEGLGTTGQFSAGDGRFFAAAGATAAHDADDRIIFNTTTREVFYDFDGTGSGASQLVATLQPGATLAATDIWIDNGSDPVQTINGTEGDDTLIGGTGNDTINGLGGNDSIRGGEGADAMSGGDGNDTLDGHNHRTFDWDLEVDTMDGGLGNDVLMVDNPDDLVSDAGGIDTVIAHNVSWTLAGGLENLVVHNDNDGQIMGVGNELDNVLGAPDEGWFLRFEGLGGNDTIYGSVQNDTLMGGDGNDLIVSGGDADIVDGGNGDDTLEYSGFGDDDMWGGAGADHFAVGTPGDFANRIHDFGLGADKLRIDGNRMLDVGATGNFAVDDARFFAGTAAHDADDRVIWDASTGTLWYDPDGTGSAAQQAVASLQFFSLGGTVVATDIEVVNGTGGGQTINGTAGNDSLVGGAASDTMFGFAGNDTLDGGGGPDSLDGGSGNDLYIVDNLSDVIVELQNGGIDEVRTSINGYVLPDLVNNLTLTGFASSGTGNAIDNVITGVASGSFLEGVGGNDTLIGGAGRDFMRGGTGNDSIVAGGGNDFLEGGEGNDTLLGGDGNDTFSVHVPMSSSWGSDVIDGGAGTDDLHFGFDGGGSLPITVNLGNGTVSSGNGSASVANVENVFGTEGADRIAGNAAANILNGLGGADTLDGGAGIDTLAGGIGADGIDAADTFLFTVTPGAANADIVNQFTSGSDMIRLDATVMSALGISGTFAAGDPRFHAAAGANSGHDADDRVVYNTITGELWYDADGSGSGAAQLIATLRASFSGPAAQLAATDIAVDNGSSGGGGQTLNGTAGNDSLAGGTGNDTINGNAGNDTLIGNAGDDSLDGGSGTDSLNGGTGNDRYVVSTGDILTDAGGIDLIFSPVNWSLSGSFENLEFTGSAAVGGSGNFMANRMVGNSAANFLRGREGNDTLTGGGGADSFEFVTAPSASNADLITDFVSGVDKLRFEDAVHSAIGAAGNFAAGDGRFWAAAGVTAGHDANDRVVYDTSTGNLYYDADGSGAGASVLVATLQGSPTISATDIAVI